MKNARNELNLCNVNFIYLFQWLYFGIIYKENFWKKHVLSWYTKYEKNIWNIILSNSGLKTLMPNSLSSLAGSLKHLVLSNNDLQDVPTMALRQLRELDHVNLNQNNISVIKDGAFWGLSKVTRLTLYDNKISTIHPDAFDGLTK